MRFLVVTEPLGARPIEVTGYTEPLCAAPHEHVEVKLSVDSVGYEAQLVRLIHGDEHPAGPGFVEHEVDSGTNGWHAGRIQRTNAGSYGLIENLPDAGSFAASVWIWPTLPAAGHGQVVMSRTSLDGEGWWLALDANGAVEFRVGEAAAQVGGLVRARAWYRLEATYDASSGDAWLAQVSRDPEVGTPRRRVGRMVAPSGMELDASMPLLLAARLNGPGHTEHFNGKIEEPRLYGAAFHHDVGIDPTAPILGAWDLAARPGGTEIVDLGPNACHGRLFNRPDRAMTGHHWDGTEHDFRHAPAQYGAIAFHEDDLEDAEWETDLVVDVGDLPSGVYAVRIRASGVEDHVPFVVRPPRRTATAQIALVLPTFSYMAYANDHVLRLRETAGDYTGIPTRYDPLDELAERHHEWGCSLYDTHLDGSGVSISSRRRPIVNLRPKYRWWASGGAQYLASDLYIVHWLEHLGLPVDVITDEDVHAEGAELLAQYRVVLTGTHPEYVTGQMLDAFEGFLGRGGRLMYLGGNGFYWVTCVPTDGTHAIEVRRGYAGTRAWESEPGEEHHAFTGERGGLWRHRGRSPNRLVGVGFAAQGWSDPSPGYFRDPASFAPEVQWVFSGTGTDPFGDYGLSMNGAAGDELDRYDPRLGSPPDAVVLASSRGHSRYYVVAHEDILQTTANINDTVSSNVRADLTYFETPAGGAVFSVASKSWCASLSWNDYENDVARITENVLRRFVEDGLD